MSEEEIRLDELSKIYYGMNKAATDRELEAGTFSGSRDLNIWDLSYYLYNRKRELKGLERHTGQEWLENQR